MRLPVTHASDQAACLLQDLGVNLNPVRGGIPAAKVKAGDGLSQQGFGMDWDVQEQEQPPQPVAGAAAEGTYDWCVR